MSSPSEQGDRSALQVVHERDAAGNALLRVAGEIDIATVPILRAAAEAALGDPTGALLFDLSDVTFMDSSGLGLLLEIERQVATIGVVDPSPAVRRVIRLSGLEQILKVTP